MSAENVRLTAVVALLLVTFAGVFVAAATGTAWLVVVAVIGGPIASVTVDLGGVRRP
jgi:hypothetical protein